MDNVTPLPPRGVVPPVRAFAGMDELASLSLMRSRMALCCLRDILESSAEHVTCNPQSLSALIDCIVHSMPDEDDISDIAPED